MTTMMIVLHHQINRLSNASWVSLSIPFDLIDIPVTVKLPWLENNS